MLFLMFIILCFYISSICVTVIVLNIHFRSPQTHTMAPWVRTIFINHLPKLLVMRRPMYGGLNQYRYVATFNIQHTKTVSHYILKMYCLFIWLKSYCLYILVPFIFIFTVLHHDVSCYDLAQDWNWDTTIYLHCHHQFHSQTLIQVYYWMH